MKTFPLDTARRRLVVALGGAASLAGLGGLGGCATGGAPAAAATPATPPQPAPTTVPHSAGSAVPRSAMPALACDCHHHIYDRRYPAHPSATLLPDDASVADYRLLQQRLGLQRHVVVQPSTYGTDNRLLVDALKAFGPTARGVAVVDTSVTDAQLRDLHAAGVRGIRFNLSFLVGIGPEMMEPLARRIAPLGWHLQVNGSADRLLAAADTLQRLACPVVFDHMGQLPQPQGLKHPAFALYARLLDADKAWFKLSGPYLTSKKSDLSDVGVVARALIGLAPERMVWGSDWPHPTKKANEKPDDAALLNLLDDWAPTAAIRQRILVDNPAQLYAF
ncbi:amidohydrolase family protein [Hydrogenophaga sp. T2]|uniref:amidohydrolase family protein n=1 Tax=Hydrogenophaga sp. T2 TaxID=3132823 RepID=UPI003CF9083E